MMISAIDRLKYASMRCYDQTAIVFGEQRITYGEMIKAVEVSAQSMSSAGVRKGGNVAIYQRNGISILVNFYATLALGACAVFLNWRLTVKELLVQIALMGCETIIVDGDFFGDIGSLVTAQGDGACQSTVLASTKLGLAPEDLFERDDLLEGASDACFVALEPDDPALVFFTGGSTGTPKAAVHCHEGIANWVDCTLNNVWTVTGVDTMVDPAPLFHLGGLQCAYFTLSAGGTLVLTPPSFNAAAVLRLIQDEHATQVNIIPQTLVQDMLDESRNCDYDLSSVKLALLMGGTAREEYPRAAFALFPNCDVIHPYGMSELAATAIMRHSRTSFEEHPERRLSVGRIGLGSVIKLLDDEGNPVEPGKPGRVFGKSFCMMRGYKNRESSFDEEGFLDTGDVMRQDEDGYFYYVGRNKLMVKTGGENVYCNEVESCIRLHPAVYNCIVFGLPHEKWGEAVSAAIELKPGCTLTAGEIVQHCRANIAHYKQPRNVFFVDKLPLNPAGKILVADVKRMLGFEEEG